MSLKKYLKALEKRKIISKKPNPIIPFIITIITLILAVLYKTPDPISIILYMLFIFTLIFSIIHLIIYIILSH